VGDGNVAERNVLRDFKPIPSRLQRGVQIPRGIQWEIVAAQEE